MHWPPCHPLKGIKWSKKKKKKEEIHCGFFLSLTPTVKNEQEVAFNMKIWESDGEKDFLRWTDGKWHNADDLANCDLNCERCLAPTGALPWARFQGINISVKVFIKYGPAHDVHTIQLLGILWEENIMYMIPHICGKITQSTKKARMITPTWLAWQHKFSLGHYQLKSIDFDFFSCFLN